MTSAVKISGIKAAENKASRTRDKILKTSARIFREQGYKATTMRGIADAVQMQAGSVYYHFKSKDDILDVVLEQGLQDIFDGVKSVIETPEDKNDFRARIYAAVQEHLKRLLEGSEFTSANIRIYGQLPKEVRKKHQPLRLAYAKLWDGFLTDAQKAGQLRADIKIAPLRQFVLGALNWTVEWFNPEKYSVEAFSDRAAKIILDGIYSGKLSHLDYDFAAAQPKASDPQTVNTPTKLSKFDRTDESILIAAAKMFQEQGYAASTMRKIATAADVKAGSFYYHYDSKKDILDAVLNRGLRDIHDGVQAVICSHEGHDNYRQIIKAAVSEHLHRLLESSEFTSANIRIYSMLPPEVRVKHQPLRRAYSKLWDDLLQGAQDAGQLRADVEIIPLRQFILGALNWTVEWFDAEKYSVNMLAERCALFLLDGVDTKSG